MPSVEIEFNDRDYLELVAYAEGKKRTVEQLCFGLVATALIEARIERWSMERAKEKQDIAKQAHSAAEQIRDAIAKLEKADSPLARDPIIQMAKQVANLGEFIIERESKKSC